MGRKYWQVKGPNEKPTIDDEHGIENEVRKTVRVHHQGENCKSNKKKLL